LSVNASGKTVDPPQFGHTAKRLNDEWRTQAVIFEAHRPDD